jgi:hypothetical protein
MKFLTLADWTGMVETELFAQTYKIYGLATVRYPVLEVTTTVVSHLKMGEGFMGRKTTGNYVPHFRRDGNAEPNLPATI